MNPLLSMVRYAGSVTNWLVIYPQTDSQLFFQIFSLAYFHQSFISILLNDRYTRAHTHVISSTNGSLPSSCQYHVCKYSQIRNKLRATSLLKSTYRPCESGILFPYGP